MPIPGAGGSTRKSALPPWPLQRGVVDHEEEEEISIYWVLAVYQALCQALEILCLTSGRVHYHTHYTVG